MQIAHRGDIVTVLPMVSLHDSASSECRPSTRMPLAHWLHPGPGPRVVVHTNSACALQMDHWPYYGIAECHNRERRVLHVRMEDWTERSSPIFE